MNCQLCGSGMELGMLCPRCRRYTCNQCWDQEWGLCQQCGIYKSELLRDRIRYLDYLDRYSNLAQDYIVRGCDSCSMLRELLLSYLKLIKQLELEAEHEGFRELKPRLEQLRSQLIQSCLKVLAKQSITAQLRDSGF